MVAEEPRLENENSKTFQIAVSVCLAACFTTVLTLFVMKFFYKLTSCCRGLFKKKRRNTGNESFNQLAMSQPYEPLSVNARRARSISMSLESLASYKNAKFEIPGRVAVETVQPIDGSTSGYSTGFVTDDEFQSPSSFIEEYIQPVDYPPSSRSLSSMSGTYASSQDGLNVDMYTSEIRRTQATGSLGKIQFSLQYEDKNKQKLILNLTKLMNLQYTRFNEHVHGIRINSFLLPDRESLYSTQMFPRTTHLDMDEVFRFTSKPHNRDFESRTVHVMIMLVEKSMKETIYGEARLPLLSHEIYSQVPTDITLGIRSCPPQNEIGDIQLVLSYIADQKRLNVMAKTVKFTNSTMLDNLTSLHIKAYLMRLGGQKLGKKRSISKSLNSYKSKHSAEFLDLMSFKLDMENFMLCTLKLSIHGKHKIFGGHVSLGKTRIGESNRDEDSKVHWRAVLGSEGIGWTMWHPIYCS